MSKASMQPIALCAEFHRSDASLGRPKKKAIAKSVAVLMVRRSSRKLIKKKHEKKRKENSKNSTGSASPPQSHMQIENVKKEKKKESVWKMKDIEWSCLSLDQRLQGLDSSL